MLLLRPKLGELGAGAAVVSAVSCLIGAALAVVAMMVAMMAPRVLEDSMLVKVEVGGLCGCSMQCCFKKTGDDTERI